MCNDYFHLFSNILSVLKVDPVHFASDIRKYFGCQVQDPCKASSFRDDFRNIYPHDIINFTLLFPDLALGDNSQSSWLSRNKLRKLGITLHMSYSNRTISSVKTAQKGKQSSKLKTKFGHSYFHRGKQ